MSPLPAARPETQEARRGDSGGSGNETRNPRFIRVSNAAWNGRPVMHREDAERYVARGRAVWLRNLGDGLDQIRLLVAHPRNRAASTEAALGYDRAAAVMIRPEELIHVPILLPKKALTDRSVQVRRHFAGRSGPAYIDAVAFGQTGRTTDSSRTTLLMTSAEFTSRRLLASGKRRT